MFKLNEPLSMMGFKVAAQCLISACCTAKGPRWPAEGD